MVAKRLSPKAILAELYERRLQWIYCESCYSTLKTPGSRRKAHHHIGQVVSEARSKDAAERLAVYRDTLRTAESCASWRCLRPLRWVGAMSRQSWRSSRSRQSAAVYVQNLFAEHRMSEIVALYRANPACKVWHDSDIALLGLQAGQMSGRSGHLLPLAAELLARDGTDPRICFAVLNPIAARQPLLVSELLQELRRNHLVRPTTALRLLEFACRARAGQSLSHLKRPALGDTTDWELLKFGASNEAEKGEILSRVLGCSVSIDTTSEAPPVGRIRAVRLGSDRTRPEPLVSVIFTAQDAASTITASLESVAAQTWRSLELLLVADGSGAATRALIEQFSARAPFSVISLSNPSRMGPFRSRNMALSRATGDYVAFHDADGWMHPRRLELQVEALEHGESASASLSRHARIDREGHFVLGVDGRASEDNLTSLLIRRSVAHNAGYFDAHKRGADSEFVERIARFWGGVVRTPALLGISDACQGVGSSSYSPAVSSQLCEYTAQWRRVHHRQGLAAMPYRIESPRRRSVFLAAARGPAAPDIARGASSSQSGRAYLRAGIEKAVLAQDHRQALAFADRGCKRFPAAHSFWIAKVLAERRLGRWRAALATTDIFKDLIEDELASQGQLIACMSGQRLRALYSLGRTSEAARLGTSLVRKFPGRFEELLFRMATHATLRGSNTWSEPALVRLSAAIPSARVVSTHGRICLLAEAMLARGNIKQAEALFQGLSSAQGGTHLLGANLAGRQDRPDLRAERLHTYFSARGQVSPFRPTTDRYEDLRSDLPDVAPVAPPGPRVSVIMTVRDGIPYVAQAIASVLQQTWTNLELIVVEDGNGDESWQSLQALAASDSRVRLLQNPKPLGTYVSRNRAIEVATGDWVACHDSDAWSHPRRLELQVAPLLNSEETVATLSESLQLTREGYFRIRSTGEYSRLNASTLMYRRSVIDRVGYYDSVRIGADAEFLDRLRFVYGAGAVVRIQQPTTLCLWRQSNPVSEAETGELAAARSGDQLAYRASFGRWHHAVRDQAYLPFPHVPRRFPAPPPITVEVTP